MNRLVAIFIYCVHAEDYYDYGGVLEFLNLNKRSGPIWNDNDTIFSEPMSYHVHASPATEAGHPWAARVVHSRNTDHPHLCTAVCVEANIFITAAICLYSKLVSYTSIVYQKQRMPVIAFVVPSKRSKQGFDDIGFLVSNDTGLNLQWTPVSLFDSTNRTDEEFGWFSRLKLPADTSDHIVVGYAIEKWLYMRRIADTPFILTKLEVYVDMKLCPEILNKKEINGYHVPCYHSCSLQLHKKNDSKCSKYHGSTGSALFNVKTKKLLGITTWAAYDTIPLPVGFSVPNSKNFFEDYTCARRIKNYKGLSVKDGYYQGLCNNKN